MKKHKISVVCPCFNEAKHLRTFLDSLVNQTFKDFEVIIVDGGSTDGSLQIIREYMDKLDIKLIIDRTRNIGFVRDLASKKAESPIMFHSCSDTYFEEMLLQNIFWLYRFNPNIISIAGRTYPLGTSIFAHLGYQCFDFLRWLFTVLPLPVRKYRPSGNFMTCRRWAYIAVDGYPHVRVNEDGLIGGRLDMLAAKHDLQLGFELDLYVGHHVKKFEEAGGLRAIMFYFYAFSNLFPMLKRLLMPFENQAALVFEGKATLETRGIQSRVKAFWNWL